MIHVIFTSSGAGSLRQALNLRDRRKKIVDLTDDLSWGPITNGDFGARQAWLNQNLPWDSSPTSVDEGWDWIASGAQEFLTKLERSDEHLIWVAPQNAKESCGLHWYLHHFGGERASFIFVDQGFPGSWNEEAPEGLGDLGAEQFQYLLENSKRHAWDEKRFPKGHWAKLCSEATNLRLMIDGTGTSVRDDHLDDLILEQCSKEWRKLGYVVGEAMIALSDVGHRKYDDFIKWRLREFARNGKIVINGPITYYSTRDKQPLIRLA